MVMVTGGSGAWRASGRDSVPGLVGTAEESGTMTRKANKANKDHAFHLVQKATIGDWFMYFLISRNMDSHTYNIFIQEITEKFKTKA